MPTKRYLHTAVRSQILRLSSVLVASSMLVWISGCGSKSELVEVGGTVLVDGQPAKSGTVSFIPEDGSGNSATGKIDESGRFVMSTHETGDGVKPGNYKVGVTIWKNEASGNEQTGQLIAPTALLPAKYMNPLESGLTAVVTEDGSQSMKFEVSTQE